MVCRGKNGEPWHNPVSRGKPEPWFDRGSHSLGVTITTAARAMV